jgi:hypothetical protein
MIQHAKKGARGGNMVSPASENIVLAIQEAAMVIGGSRR